MIKKEKIKRVRCWRCRNLKNNKDVQYLKMRYLSRNITLKTCNTCIATITSSSYEMEMQYREEQQRLAKIAAIGYSHVIKDTMFKPNPWLRFLKFKRGGKPMKQK